jgi:leucyl aminopeptidase
MKITVQALNITQFTGDTVIVNLFEGVTSPGGATGAIDKALDGAIGQLISDGELKGKLNTTTVIHTFGKIPAKRVIIVGLGKPADFTLDRVRQVAATAIKAARRLGAKSVATVVHGAGIGDLDPLQAAQAVTEGTLLGLYRFKKYVTKPLDNDDPESLTIAELDQAKLAALQQGVWRGTVYAEATNYARDLVNEPGNVATPTYLADQAEAIAREFELEVSILERRQMEELGMGSILAVAQGSEQSPKLIVLRYWGAGKDDKRPPLALIGKAVTFDSGGISIKPADNMGEMKGDMSGGAAVLGALRAIAQLKPKINVTGLVPAVENMPSGKASRPGDIVKTMSGKTYEIISTDAEGRMILADALTYARRLGCSPLIDAATLTGAIITALGFEYTGAFTNDQATLDKVLTAAKAAGEKVWPMPTDEAYKEQLESDVADMKNVGGRWAGAITGALFIGTFAEGTPWVHLDIAGTSKTGPGKDGPYQPKFGSGVMTRTFAALAEMMQA